MPRARLSLKAERFVWSQLQEALVEGIRGEKRERNRMIHEAVSDYGYTVGQLGELVQVLLLDRQSDCKES